MTQKRQTLYDKCRRCAFRKFERDELVCGLEDYRRAPHVECYYAHICILLNEFNERFEGRSEWWIGEEGAE